jgi:hypothetical protein
MGPTVVDWPDHQDLPPNLALGVTGREEIDIEQAALEVRCLLVGEGDGAGVGDAAGRGCLAGVGSEDAKGRVELGD